ncbi:type III polyketide synthase [Portibacter marinus]|uniref:type III polyketide synthase n=1 Tax=Portibacter marinus TaxID=2898660 RepID=UPI001F2A61AA|nr:type III polyketide synthase [Portibacter marinus]
MSFINSIGIANPAYKSEQMQIYEYMIGAIPFNERERKILKYLYKKSGINSRYSVLPDFSNSNGTERFYNEKNNFNPRVENRLSKYDDASLPLATKAISNCLLDSNVRSEEITHLITISCTGMSAPGMDTEIIRDLKLNTNLQRFNITFMGCFAAINGLKLAHTICKAEPNAKVLVVSVELCTLHFQNEISEDYNLSNMLFADGAAATIVTSQPLNGRALSIHGFHSEINDDGVKDMSWNISSSGFLMKLSSYVPALLKTGFKGVIDKVLEHYQLKYDDLQYWAIHPGGKRILDNIEKEFHLEVKKLEASREVLREFGNMSSPTILFVLKNLLENGHIQKGQYIFTAAFGPGLTTETALLSYA